VWAMRGGEGGAQSKGVLGLGLNKILPLPILYAYIAIKGGRGDIIYCAIVWAMRGGEGGGGA